MKIQFNLTTSPCDLERFPSRAEFLALLEGFDGVELMVCGEDERSLVRPEDVVGLHMSSFYFWLDFWKGDRARCMEEFGTPEAAHAFYGGTDRQALIDRFRADLANAKKYGAEYMVYHIADSSSLETLTGRYAHTDEEVIDAACDLINEALPADTDGPLLLLENLWEPGLTFTRPEMTERLLRGVRYPRTGIMLDTGHLMHTNLSLRSQKEALAYIHRCLDEHGDLCKHIHGIHLNQSLTGAYMRRVRRNPPQLSDDYNTRMGQLFEYVFQADQHKPFTCPGVGELIERIAPEYLTFEFISNDLAQHKTMLRRQRRALEAK